MNVGRPERAVSVCSWDGSVLMVTIGFTSSLVRFHTVVGSLCIEVFGVCVREAQGQTDRCKTHKLGTERTQRGRKGAR